MWFSRGVPHRNLPSEFRWQGLDGTQIDAYWLRFFYAHLYNSPKEIAGFTRFFVERFAQLAGVVSGPGRVRGRREQVRLEDGHAESGERVAVVLDCPSPVGCIGRHQPCGKWTRVHQRRVDDGPDVLLESTHVVGGVVAVGFTRLREEIDHQHDYEDRCNHQQDLTCGEHLNAPEV